MPWAESPASFLPGMPDRMPPTPTTTGCFWRNSPACRWKAGRRGSLNGTLIVTGRQGHVAYPERADNPIRGLMILMAALQAPLDEGSEHFSPSHLEFTSVDVGNATVNLIPGEARARFNIRW